MIHACISIRPGTIIGYKGDAYKVTKNYTMDRVIEMTKIESPHLTKTLHYSPGQEISIRWKPDYRI